jgi:hypothetical protein
MTTRTDPNFHGIQDIGPLAPWASAAIARESIISGNEFRSSSPTSADVQRLANLHHRVFVEGSEDSLTRILGPILHEQFPWQYSLFEDLTRSISVFADPLYGPVYPWEDVIGLDLASAIRALFVLEFMIRTNGGQWRPEALDNPELQEVWDRYARRGDVETIARFLTATPAQLRSAAEDGPPTTPGMEKYPFNPLPSKPLVDLGKDGIWAPVGPMLLRTLLPATLFYVGAEAWGQGFARDLGSRHEAYVGALLRSLGGEVRPAVRHGKGGGQAGVDWIWVNSRAVVLIECKSARVAVDARAGTGRFSNLIQRTVQKAYEQIDHTAAMIETRHTSFDWIPGHLPIVGMAVTSEPFYLANIGLTEWGPRGQTPTVVASTRDIEHFVTHPGPDAIDLLLEIFADNERRTWDFGQAIKRHATGLRNPVSERAWNQIAPHGLSKR